MKDWDYDRLTSTEIIGANLKNLTLLGASKYHQSESFHLIVLAVLIYRKNKS